MQGKIISSYVDTSVIYPEIENNPASVYSFLLSAGYLKSVKTESCFDGNHICDIAIPNKEIFYVYGKEMPFMKVREICDIFKDKIKTITITGGEPLLHSNCAEIILMVAKQFTTYLLTNGFYLDKISVEYLNMLKSIQISLYGYNNETYKKFTGISQGYDFLQKGIQHLHKSDIKDIIMSVVVTRESWNELDKYIESTIEMKVPFMKFGISFPSGRANSNDNFFLQKKNFLKFIVISCILKKNIKRK